MTAIVAGEDVGENELERMGTREPAHVYWVDDADGASARRTGARAVWSDLVLPR